MTSRELIHWSQQHDRRARRFPAILVPALLGIAFAAWVAWRASAGASAASHAWLAGALIGFGVAFLRVPFHIYWRSDAALLAQLPIEGEAIFDAALVRCIRGALATALVVGIGAVPLAIDFGTDALLAHLAFGGALAAAAALLIPAVTVGAAGLVVEGGAASALRTATALAGAPASTPKPAEAQPPVSQSAVLGALPGLAAAVVLAAAVYVAPWLLGEDRPAPIVLAIVAAISIVGGLAARGKSAVMGRVLRDVSALDRQRLATLEVLPPTAIERLIAGLIGDAALPYRKNAQLMRRRFPLAFALGALDFIVLVVVGIVAPVDPTPWLMVAFIGAAAYAIVLATRLRQAPIELARLSATLPLTPRAHARARLAWIVGWWIVFVAVPGAFAALRQVEPMLGLALLGSTSLIVIVAGSSSR